MKSVKTLYPSILYDVYYYVALYEFKDIKAINPNYYDIIEKQIKKLPMIDDEEMNKRRAKFDFLYDDEKLDKVRYFVFSI